MEATSELMQKLQRRRERMGESGTLLRDVVNELPARPSVSPEYAKGSVKQRASRFEGAENHVNAAPAKIGKVNIERWEREHQARFAEAARGGAASPAAGKAARLRTPVAPSPAAARPDERREEDSAVPLGKGELIHRPCAELRPEPPLVSAGAEPCSPLERVAGEGKDLGEVAKPSRAVQRELAGVPPTGLASDMPAAQNAPEDNCTEAAVGAPGTEPTQMSGIVQTAEEEQPEGALELSAGTKFGPEDWLLMLAEPQMSADMLADAEADSPAQEHLLAVACGTPERRAREQDCAAIPGGLVQDGGFSPFSGIGRASSPEPQVVTPRRELPLSQYSIADGESVSPCKSRRAFAGGVEAESFSADGQAVSELLWHGAPDLDKDGTEPLEYAMLDYFDRLPEGLIRQLKVCLDNHDELVHQLQRRFDQLRERARKGTGEAAAEGAEASDKEPDQVADAEGQPAAATWPKEDAEPAVAGSDSVRRAAAEPAEAWRRELRAQMATRVAMAQEARLRLAAEAHEAAMRARLDYTNRAAKEKVAAMTMRAERDEEDVRIRALTAKSERERTLRDLEAAQRELARGRAQCKALEEEIAAADARCRRQNKFFKAKTREAETLRSELKAHRARAAKSQTTEKRVKDLQRELQATLAALEQATAISLANAEEGGILAA
mmetsp:Transcript_78135/g.201205  ORF Transcript_78135/g.201205 Transcript_78135/m.201205 type:complete len:668 (+) Transcript_78135:53-2056(+)